MIHVDRSRIPRPSFFESAAVEQARRRMLEGMRARQSDIDLKDLWHSAQVKNALVELFHGKCAYCETPISIRGFSDIDHFRPKRQALNLDGSVDGPHYLWLAYEWENLYLSCARCSQMKGSRFPVEGARAPAETPWAKLPEYEQALLLDPCRDDPERELMFDEATGIVYSSTRRGQITIEVFGLNRESLPERRQRVAHQTKAKLTMLMFDITQGTKPLPEDFSLETLTGASQPYAAFHRQVVATWMQSLSKGLRVQLTAAERPTALEAITKSIQPLDVVEPITSTEGIRRYRQDTLDKSSKAKLEMESYDLRSKKGAEGYFARTRLIDRIEIHNFRTLRDLDIRLGQPATPPPSSPAQQTAPSLTGSAPWLALIGENGSGKSSILQAVALALADDEYRQTLPCKPADVLTWGEKEGHVKVHLTGDEVIELRYKRGSSRFEAMSSRQKVLYLGYGATRLLPRGDHRSESDESIVRAANLFDPFIPLLDAERWLLTLNDAKFEAVSTALKDLLALEAGYRFIRKPKVSPPRVVLEHLGVPQPLRHLSDGYQSVLALACDIMAVMVRLWEVMEIAEGIVLIDELEAHLHPRWKQRIATSLRRAYPRIQFLYSTHDPLCLQNAPPGEVHIMKRDPQTGVVSIHQQDVPPGLRADQILTGWWFGLPKTIDDDTFSLMEEHRQLLLREKSPQNERHRVEIEAILRARLGGFAETSIERLALGVTAEVIDAEKRQVQALTPDDRAELRAKILGLVRTRREG